jgi:hypothetical protein
MVQFCSYLSWLTGSWLRSWLEVYVNALTLPLVEELVQCKRGQTAPGNVILRLGGGAINRTALLVKQRRLFTRRHIRNIGLKKKVKDFWDLWSDVKQTLFSSSFIATSVPSIDPDSVCDIFSNNKERRAFSAAACLAAGFERP